MADSPTSTLQNALNAYVAALNNNNEDEILRTLSIALSTGIPEHVLQALLNEHAFHTTAPVNICTTDNNTNHHHHHHHHIVTENQIEVSHSPVMNGLVVTLPSSLPEDFDERVRVFTTALEMGVTPALIRSVYRFADIIDHEERVDQEESLEVAVVLTDRDEEGDEEEERKRGQRVMDIWEAAEVMAWTAGGDEEGEYDLWDQPWESPGGGEFMGFGGNDDNGDDDDDEDDDEDDGNDDDDDDNDDDFISDAPEPMGGSDTSVEVNDASDFSAASSSASSSSSSSSDDAKTQYTLQTQHGRGGDPEEARNDSLDKIVDIWPAELETSKQALIPANDWLQQYMFRWGLDKKYEPDHNSWDHHQKGSSLVINYTFHQRPEVIPADLRAAIRNDLARSRKPGDSLLRDSTLGRLSKLLCDELKPEQMDALIHYIRKYDHPNAPEAEKKKAWARAERALRPNLAVDLGRDVTAYIPLKLREKIRSEYTCEYGLEKETLLQLKALCRDDLRGVETDVFDALLNCILFYDHEDPYNMIGEDMDGCRITRLAASDALKSVNDTIRELVTTVREVDNEVMRWGIKVCNMRREMLEWGECAVRMRTKMKEMKEVLRYVMTNQQGVDHAMRDDQAEKAKKKEKSVEHPQEASHPLAEGKYPKSLAEMWKEHDSDNNPSRTNTFKTFQEKMKVIEDDVKKYKESEGLKMVTSNLIKYKETGMMEKKRKADFDKWPTSLVDLKSVSVDKVLEMNEEEKSLGMRLSDMEDSDEEFADVRLGLKKRRLDEECKKGQKD